MPIRTWLTLSAIWPLALATESSLSRSFSATTSKSSITSNVTWRGEGGGDINRLNASNGSSSPLMPPNCTQLCRVWKGEECYEYRPCMFCNQSVSCDPDYLVCRENVCMLDEYEGNLFVVYSTTMIAMMMMRTNTFRSQGRCAILILWVVWSP